MRFTIRELVLVTVIVAMGAAWWIDRRAQFSDANSRAEKHQAEVARPQLESPRSNAPLEAPHAPTAAVVDRLDEVRSGRPSRSGRQRGNGSGKCCATGKPSGRGSALPSLRAEKAPRPHFRLAYEAVIFEATLLNDVFAFVPSA